MTEEQENVISKIAKATVIASDWYGVPIDRLRAHLWAESSWGEEGTNPRIKGSDGYGTGIAQIDPRFHAFASDPLDTDILLQVCYEALFLTCLLRANGGDWHAASKAYNGSGPAADAYADKIEKFIAEKPWQKLVVY